MKIQTFIELNNEVYPGQLSYNAVNGRLHFRELTCKSGEPEPELDVTELINELESVDTSTHEMLTACSDALLNSLCVDCKVVHDDDLEYMTYAPYDVAQFADIAGERICTDCTDERGEY